MKMQKYVAHNEMGLMQTKNSPKKKIHFYFPVHILLYDCLVSAIYVMAHYHKIKNFQLGALHRDDFNAFYSPKVKNYTWR